MVPGECLNSLSSRPWFSEFSFCVCHLLTRTLSLLRCSHRTSPNQCCPPLHLTSKTYTNSSSGLHGTQFHLKSPPQSTMWQEFAPFVPHRLHRLHCCHSHYHLKPQSSLHSTGSESHKSPTIKAGSSGISNHQNPFPSV